jgi:hypothetical protein
MPARPRKTKTRQKHQVDARMKVRDITRAGTSLELDIYGDGKKLGVMTIGAGSMMWKRGRSAVKRIRWSEFAEMMQDL